eukprot:2959088-Rhodomonas_salina.1
MWHCTATAYNDAAGRVLCPISRIGDLGGKRPVLHHVVMQFRFLVVDGDGFLLWLCMTLAPGLYKSTSGMAVVGSDLFLDAQHDGDA